MRRRPDEALVRTLTAATSSSTLLHQQSRHCYINSCGAGLARCTLTAGRTQHKATRRRRRRRRRGTAAGGVALGQARAAAERRVGLSPGGPARGRAGAAGRQRGEGQGARPGGSTLELDKTTTVKWAKTVPTQRDTVRDPGARGTGRQRGRARDVDRDRVSVPSTEAADEPRQPSQQTDGRPAGPVLPALQARRSEMKEREREKKPRGERLSRRRNPRIPSVKGNSNACTHSVKGNRNAPVRRGGERGRLVGGGLTRTRNV